MVVCAALASDARVRYTGKLKIVDAVIRDETGSLRVTWFNMMYLKDVLRSGKRYVFKGKLSVSRFGMVLEQPVIYAPETYVPLIGKLRPIYSLPFALTGAQKRCYQEILADLTGPKLMNRLVQGDVDSGKTIVALLALMQMAYGGYQGALMAPTEVLARQHYENFTRLFAQAQINLRVELLTGSMTAKEKREAYGRIAAHETDIVVGTHAVIQDKVHFARLELVITDEQHRFGVRQRENLAGKGQEGMEQGRQQSLPHVLVMSAMPIPRTLAIILYGDLDISVIDEKPVGRLPIKNCLIGASRRKKAYEFITNQVKEDFAAGRIQVLVSMTVVEVGVDVPNATVMVVENAERFGLAQLHQLRGRIGRGKYQSYCIFINGSDASKVKRLEILTRTNDGFEIASEDLKLRGPGDIFGLRQSGLMDFALGDIYTDAGILKEASEAAGELLAQDYELRSEENRELKKRLDRYLERKLDTLSL